MKAELLQALEQIRPRVRERVMDVVAAAGIDVEGWKVKADGSPVAIPQKNPDRCFEWSFGGDGEPIALCIWHNSLMVDDQKILYKDNLRALAFRLDRMADDRLENAKARRTARKQARRAHRFDADIRLAYERRLPVRAILLEGRQRDRDDLGWDVSKVKLRGLDGKPWYVHSYDVGTGEFALVREVVSAHDDDLAVVPSGGPAAPIDDALDDIGAPPPGVSNPQRTANTGGSGFQRDDKVRSFVIRRAGGICEYCKKPGFSMENGNRYLEAHHILTLGAGGPDTVENVIALCANDHREAHYGSNRLSIEQEMLDMMASLHPKS